jgi:glycerol uptake facilitator-like aquaporin
MLILRRIAAEAVGTGSLLAIVVGSGIMGDKLSAGNAAIALLANALATGFGLYVLISVFAPLSGAHFNPIVSVGEYLSGQLRAGECLAFVVTQFAAGIAGVALTHFMFEQTVVQLGAHHRAGASQLISEAVATAGLIVTIRGTATRGATAVAAAVGSYIAAAYWFTASTSFANPAVTLARGFTTTFAGIAINDVVGFVVAQCVGGTIGYALAGFLFPIDRDLAT